MGVFNLGKMTVKSFFRQPETIQYPVQSEPSFQTLRGTICNDIDKCIFCGICSKKCPADAIEVDKANSAWTINVYRCVQCGACVLECPKSCLSFDTKRPSAATTKAAKTFTKVVEPASEAE